MPTMPGDAERGADLIADYGCGSCHVIPGIPQAEGRVGPSLQSWAERAMIAGQLRNRPAVLVRWLQDPTELIPRTGMPDQGVTREEAVDMAAYLYTLGSPAEFEWPPTTPAERDWYEAPYEPEGLPSAGEPSGGG